VLLNYYSWDTKKKYKNGKKACFLSIHSNNHVKFQKVPFGRELANIFQIAMVLLYQILVIGFKFGGYGAV
jgi:hypothetical protein